MKQIILFFVCTSIIFACATKKEIPVEEPTPIQEEVIVEEPKGPFLPNGVTLRESIRGKLLEFLPKNLFEYRKADLPESVKESFEIVKEVLQENEGSKIILEAHTSNKGVAYPFNYELSQERAKNGKKYFIENGIEADRITEYGLGEAVPEYETQEELRRFEFIFIENSDDLNKYEQYLKSLDFKAEAPNEN